MNYGKNQPIHVGVRRLADSASISVRDHGIGIVEGAQARIFNRFERALSARNPPKNLSLRTSLSS